MMPDFPMDTAPPQNSDSLAGRVAVWAITPNGRQLGEKLCHHVKQARLFLSSRLADHLSGAPAPGAGNTAAQNIARQNTGTGAASVPKAVHRDKDGVRKRNLCRKPDTKPKTYQVFNRLSEAVAEQFQAYDCHVFIFSTGIAVRIISPLLVSKLIDPAVVVVDDRGCHAVSLISGHIGQANLYTRQIAHLLGADPVITTATDVNHLPSMDLLADKLNLFIETPETIKTINMAFLQNKKIGLHDPLNLVSPWLSKEWIDNTSSHLPQVVCDWRQKKVSRETLVLRPRVLAVGIGCNRHTPVETLIDFFLATLASAGISRHSISMLATSDIKQDEPGILALAEHLHLPIRFYDKHQLSSVKTIQTPSKMVKKHIGVTSVCEAAAILASGNGTLILPKQKNADVTLAAAIQKTGSLWWGQDREM
jgi:cobalt-precorrin 5A hydrolase